MLTLHTAYDVQLSMRDFLIQKRKQQRFTVEALSTRSGVPYGTIRKFESTGNISFRQFLMLCEALGKIDEMLALTKEETMPKSIEEVLKDQ